MNMKYYPKNHSQLYVKLLAVKKKLTGPFISQLWPKDPTWLHWINSYKSGIILKDWQKMNKDDMAINIMPKLCSSICFLVKVLLGRWTKLCHIWQLLLGFCIFLLWLTWEISSTLWWFSININVWTSIF